MNDLINNDEIKDLTATQNLCAMLVKTPHYAKMGPEGIFAIVESAKSLNVDPRLALSGGLYFVKGKVEMSSRLMNSLIRSKKHSITKDRKSDDAICILHGRRSDTGDTWTESFSIDEARRAGLVRAGGPWSTFPRDMLFARALSRLARQLFPDCIGNCYVEGEIALDENIKDPKTDVIQFKKEPVEPIEKVLLSDDKCKLIGALLDKLPEYSETVHAFLDKRGIQEYRDIPLEMYEKIIKKANDKLELEGEK